MQSLISLFCVLLCAGAWSGQSLAGSAPIKQEMIELYSITSTLMPLTLQKSAFEDPKNKAEIARHMTRLKSITTSMAKRPERFYDSDPMVKSLSERFSEDISFAIRMWNDGDRVIPRRILRETTDYCITCHTRTNKGPDFKDLPLPPKFASYPQATKADYFSATRQYDKAIDAFEKLLSDRYYAKSDPYGWQQGIRKLLAITVRVKENPSLTLEVISRIGENPDAADPALAQSLAYWRGSAKDWHKLAVANSSKPTAATESINAIEALLKDALRLEGEREHAGLIQYLRASLLAHKLLPNSPAPTDQQKLLLLAGESVHGVQETNLWTLQDTYFEQCLQVKKEHRNKSLSQNCFDSLTKSYQAEYGVTATSPLPDFVKNRLDVLKKNLN